VSSRLPDFPWDRLLPARGQAAAHPDGIVDLSIGTPVDPVPEVIQRALTAGANAPGYPTTVGSLELRRAAIDWMDRRLGVGGIAEDGVLPLIGSKEFVAWLPTLLEVGQGDRVVVPELAYPTYEVGARISGAEIVRSDSTVALGPAPVALIWLNSPSNPTGRVLPAEHLRKVVAWARERGVIVVSDECYVELGWEAQPVSVLHPDVCGGSTDHLLAVHSLSKRSNLAGYRAGFVAGDPSLIGRLLEVRKHAGMMVPSPVQSAMVAALEDDAHVSAQRERYQRRRQILKDALLRAGLQVDHSEAGLYLWATRTEPCGQTISWLAERGILGAPGDFYGASGSHHVRLALTASDERMEAAALRLTP